MHVILEAIKFNHDPDSAISDAFNIRRNETESVSVPEWRRGVSVKPEDSPAAYARDALQGRAPTIRAKFSFLGFDSAVRSIKIRAVDGRLTPQANASESTRFVFEFLAPVFREALSDNVLGTVMEREVNLQGGEEFELFNLDNVRINSSGVTVSDIIWRWQFRTGSIDWIDFATTTHRIFTVLAMPTAPWEPESFENSNTQQPWVEVLDYACRWAASATHVDEAATLITRTINGLGLSLMHYDNPNGGSMGFFTTDSPPAFDCTDFLTLLRGQKNRHGSGVNCDDCAALVATFSNMVGCDLFEAEMDNGNDSIPLNPHLRIGLPQLLTSYFSHHTVAWKGACGEDDELFDACLQLDSDKCPAEQPHPLFVPTNIRFGQPHEHLYRFRLARDESKCMPNGVKRRRKVATLMLEGDGALDHIMEFLEKTSSGRQDKSRLAVEFLVSKLLSKKSGVPPWIPKNYRFLDEGDSLFSIQSFWRHEEEVNANLRLDIFFAASIVDARDKLKKLYSRYQLTDIAQRKHPDFGDAVFAVPTNFAIIFIRGAYVFQLRNIGEQPVSCESFARFIDQLLADHFETDAGQT